MLRAALVYVKMHGTIVGATHFFLVGYRWLPRAGKCYKSIYGQLRWNMWEYELIRYRLVRGGRAPRPITSNRARVDQWCNAHSQKGGDASQPITNKLTQQTQTTNVVTLGVPYPTPYVQWTLPA